MITILNPVVKDGIATADIKIYSSCCKTTLKVLAHYSNGIFSDAINIDTGATIYIAVQQDLIKEWLKYLNEHST